MVNIEIDTLRDILHRTEKRLNSPNRSENSSYREILDEIKQANTEIYNQLNTNINHLFRVSGNIFLNTLLHFAAKENCPQTVKLLLSNDANINAGNSPNHYTPLHFAAENGHSEVVRELLDHGANVDAEASLQRKTPLHCTAQNGHAEVVQKLLNHGANVDAVTLIDQKTPLHYAAENGYSEIVQELLIKGADITKRNNSNQTPLECAVGRGCEDASKVLIKYTLAQNISAEKPNFATLLPSNLLHETLSKYWDLELTKTINIGSIGIRQVSLYDFLTAYDAKLGLYVKTLNALSDPDQLLERFPEFSDILSNRIEKAYLYNEIIEKVQFYREEGSILPPELVEKINQYLSHEDRQNLLKALTPLQGSGKDLEQVNNESEMEKLGENNSELDNTEQELKTFTREPISIFQEIQKAEEQKKKQHLESLLNELKTHCPNEFKIGAAIGKGDCFFDSLAQGLNELKDKGLIVSDKRFNAKSLRKECASYADEYKDKIIQDAKEGGYFVALQGPYGPIQDPETKENKIDNEDTFKLYLKEIKKISEESNNPIWGRTEIEGKMICEKYKVQITAIELRNEEVGGLHVTTSEVGKNSNTIYIVNYKNHFVPLLSDLQQDIKEISREEAYEVPHSLDADTRELNKDDVDKWAKPKISVRAEDSTATRFDGQIILQLEDDPVVMEAAARLAAKHPESSVIVQLDAQRNYQEVYGNLDTLKGQENLRWQVVGHGRSNIIDKTLGGYSATELADEIADFTIELDTEYNISSSPKYISLVGCSLVDTIEMNYARELALSLDEQGIRADIAARSARVAVTYTGKKLTEDSSGKWKHKISEDKIIYAWNQDGELVPQIGKRATELLKSIDLAENFHQSMSELYKSNQLPEGKWWPILRNVAKDTKTDSYQVKFINAEQQLQTATTHDQRIINFIEDYNEKLAIVKEAYDNAGTQGRSVFDVESVDGLNSAFIVKTLIPWFANKSRMAVADDNVPEILKTALQVHTWVNLAQMGHGAVEDIDKTAGLYEAAIAISEGKEVASVTTSSLQHVSTGAGVLLNIGSVVLDSITAIKLREREVKIGQKI